MESSAPVIGLYGKVPAVGDFVTRGLPVQFVSAWDDWLSHSLVAAQTQLAGDWPAAFDGGGHWRYALEPGVLGDTAWLGVMAPSRDRVGRRFPLTLAASLPAGSVALERAVLSEDFYASLEHVLAAARIEPAPSPDELALSLVPIAAALSAQRAPHGAELADCTQFLATHHAASLPITRAAGLADTVSALGARALAAGVRGLTTWWSGANAQPPAMYCFVGLPGREVFRELLAAREQGAQAAAVWTTEALDATSPMLPVVEEPAQAVVTALPHFALARAVSTIAGVAAQIVALLHAGVQDDLAPESVAGAELAPRLAALDPAADYHLAACCFGEDSVRLWWSGQGAVFRLRDAVLARIDVNDTAGASAGSLMDLLSAPTGAPQARERVRSLTEPLQPGDRYLLSIGPHYNRLSWGQLVSALGEESPALAIERLQDAADAHGPQTDALIVFVAGIEAGGALAFAPVAPVEADAPAEVVACS